MLNELDNLSLELKSDKAQVRQKAFNKCYELLQSRLTEIQKFLHDNKDFSWEDLFLSAHKGIGIQSKSMLKSKTEVNEADPKIKSVSKVILKICDSPPDGE